MTILKFKRIEAGHYATADGRYAVVVDGYVKSAHCNASADYNHRTGVGQYEGFQGGEWAACYDPAGNLRDSHNDGENLDWFPTKREAVEHCNWHARSRD